LLQNINLYTTRYKIKRLLSIDTGENILANLREYALKYLKRGSFLIILST